MRNFKRKFGVGMEMKKIGNIKNKKKGVMIKKKKW